LSGRLSLRWCYAHDFDLRGESPPHRIGPGSRKGRDRCGHRNGKPIFDLVPHRQKSEFNFKAIRAFKRKHDIGTIFTCISDDFDAPLPEDFLLRPLG
jgi:hypothetical protein